MQIERLQLNGDLAAFVQQIRALLPVVPDVTAAVQQVISTVRAQGDAALTAYTQRFDTGGAKPLPLRVEVAELKHSLSTIDKNLREGLQLALENVQCVASAELEADSAVQLSQGQSVNLRDIPVGRAGVYAPGGNYPYPSTVIMAAGTARAAGVEHVSVCVPPTTNCNIHPVTLAACALCEVDVVYRVGGAQAIAALAYGTESIDPVDVIVGPGNHYVQEAKRQVFGQVGIDSIAGPSDLLVIFAAEADPELIALDLLAQGEHGTQTLAIGVSPDAQVLAKVATKLSALGGDYPTSTEATYVLIETGDFESALSLSDTFAPEHLELVGVQAEQLLPQVQNAGCVLIGRNGAAAFSDYVAGSNHVLPTGGSARFASELGPRHFRRRRAEVHIPDSALSPLARSGAHIAAAEGFRAHQASMMARRNIS